MTVGMISRPTTDFVGVKEIFDYNYIRKEIVKEEIKEMVENSYDFEDLKFKLLDYLR